MLNPYEAADIIATCLSQQEKNFLKALPLDDDTF
jgi:hypothetical protein